MPPSAALIARDQRILAGYRADATIPELCLGEDVSPQVVREVLRTAGVTLDRRRSFLRSAAAERRCETVRRRRPPLEPMGFWSAA